MCRIGRAWTTLVKVLLAITLACSDTSRVEETPSASERPTRREPRCTNQACTEANGGSAAICNRTGNGSRCTALTTIECPRVVGPFEQDDAVIVATFDPMWHSSKLAAVEINAFGLGLRDGGGRPQRPIAFVRCIDDPSQAGLTHVLDELRLPGIIGPPQAHSFVEYAKRTVPAGVFMLGTSVAGISVTDLPDDGLVWRVATSPIWTVPALALSVGDLEAKLRASGLTGPFRIAVTAANSVQAQELLAALLPQLQLHGAPIQDPSNTTRLAIINHDWPPLPTSDDFARDAERLLAFEPHIVVSISDAQSAGIALALDERWTQTAFRPEWLFAVFRREPAWLSRIASAPGLAARVRGVYMADFTDLTPAFEARYEAAMFGARSSGAAYDALYTLAFAWTAAAAEGPIDGRSLADAMSKLVPPGPRVDVGSPHDIERGLSALAAGESIDLHGVSSDLDFDLATGEPGSDATPVLVFCVGMKDGALQYLPSGRYYDPVGKTLQGRFECPD